ncbi:D-alanyl-D-alanine carboxypeptidase/D-alanyl-D-alanine endopeptidase [Dactylosporangium aurantiacum]|uniref:D-alanyl-D-alanine carboxypeptidase/D-alanyl-D-alanine endopeptidase n=1 Tax=Dactylosporangium aurantiacum TaxID=35754 RepID=UPI000694F0D7|nr:D-alanyl-D-alanine carboxypeptidase/D-alanyl-D-alanine-endopeptidase [Dactylosporangium aurantiacum]MDG6100728.1 D-alanyl-D-alanine carboxypeptidase/D-alanyl-D-alanine-endopeptidase [Dactylosporangium aurantiacum]
MARERPQVGTVAAAVALVVALVAALASVYAGPETIRLLGLVDPGERTKWTAGVAPELPPAVLTAMDGQAPLPSPDGVKAALAPLLAAPALGPHITASVVDVATGQVLYSSEPDAAMTPASTTKVVTGVAALAARGPAYRIPTRVVAGAQPGEVVLIGGGDPTLAVFQTPYYPGAARLDDLAAQVKKALGDTTPTKVVYDGSLFVGSGIGPGWDADATTEGSGAVITPIMTEGGRPNSGKYAKRHPQPDIQAAQAFAKLLGLPPAAVVTGTAPAGAQELGKVESAPMVRLVEFMLLESDNVLADILARQVALAKGQPASFEGGAAAMRTVLEGLNVPVTAYGLVDGSGFSRNDRLSPALLTTLLAMAARSDRADLHGIFSGLPVAGYSGTLAGRFTKPQEGAGAAGLVRAKTGTLTGVNSLTGIVVDADGRTLAFAFMADQTTDGPKAVVALDRVAAALAACGCR